jgi:hypothetical protein
MAGLVLLATIPDASWQELPAGGVVKSGHL